MVAQRQAEDDGRRHEPACVAAIGVPAPLSPPHEQEQQQGDEGEVERVGIRAKADAPDGGGECQSDTGRQREESPPRELDHHRGGEAAGGRDEQRGEEVRSQRFVAEWLEQDRRQPGEQRVAGIAGRVGDAEHRSDGLELGRVPERDVGQEGAHLEGERDEERREGRRKGAPRDEGRGRTARAAVSRRGPRRRGGGSRCLVHHPSVTPQ